METKNNNNEVNNELILPDNNNKKEKSCSSFDVNINELVKGYMDNGKYFPYNFIRRGSSYKEIMDYILAVNELVISNLYYVHLFDLIKVSHYPKTDSLPPTNELMVYKLDNCGKFVTCDETNRSKNLVDYIGHLLNWLKELNGKLDSNQKKWSFDNVGLNASGAFNPNIFGTLIMKQWKDAEIGGAIQFRVKEIDGVIYLFVWGGENRHRSLYSFMTNGFPIFERKGKGRMDKNGEYKQYDIIGLFDPTEQKKIMDYYNSKIGSKKEKVNIKKLLSTFRNKVARGDLQYLRLSYENLESLVDTCSECKKAVDIIKKTAYIPIKLSPKEVDDQIIMNAVESEYKHKTPHTPVMQMVNPMAKLMGNVRERKISIHEMLSIILDDARGKVKLSESAKKYATDIWNANNTFPFLEDLKSDSDFRGHFLVRHYGVLCASIESENKDKIGEPVDCYSVVTPKQLQLLKENDGTALLTWKKRIDAHEVDLIDDEKQYKNFVDKLKESMGRIADSYEDILQKMLPVQYDKTGTEILQTPEPRLTKYHVHQVTERIYSNALKNCNSVVRRDGHDGVLKYKQGKKSFIKVYAEEFLPQLMRRRMGLLISQKQISVDDIPNLLDLWEDELVTRTAMNFSNGKYDEYLRSTKNGKIFLDTVAKLKLPPSHPNFNDDNFSLCGELLNHRDNFVSKEKLEPGQDPTLFGPDRYLTNLEILMILGETWDDKARGFATKINVDVVAVMYDMTLIELSKEFDSDGAKEDLRGIRKAIASYLLEVFDTPQPDKKILWDYDMVKMDQYISVSQEIPLDKGEGEIEYSSSKEIRIYKKDCDNEKLPEEIQMSHWISEMYCKRGENGNIVLPTHKKANNLGGHNMDNHDLFYYAHLCVSNCKDALTRNGTRKLYEASLYAQGIDQYDIDKILSGEINTYDDEKNIITEGLYKNESHYIVVKNRADAIEQFKNTSNKFNKK
jgi:hypothetical protein